MIERNKNFHAYTRPIRHVETEIEIVFKARRKNVKLKCVVQSSQEGEKREINPTSSLTCEV